MLACARTRLSMTQQTRTALDQIFDQTSDQAKKELVRGYWRREFARSDNILARINRRIEECNDSSKTIQKRIDEKDMEIHSLKQNLSELESVLKELQSKQDQIPAKKAPVLKKSLVLKKTTIVFKNK